MVELRDEVLEGAPEGHQVGRGVRAGVVGDEAGVARRDAGDLAGAEIDQEIELRVGVSEGRGDDTASLGIVDQVVAVFIVGDEREAVRDDVTQVHLQRRDRPEAPEDPQDDLPERVHGWEYTRASGAVSSGEGYPTVWRAKVLGDWEN